MLPAFVRSVVLAGCVVLVPQVIHAQEKMASSAPVLQGRDSAVVLSRARSAQAGFERYRYHRLPRTLGGGGRRECDEVIGRFCWQFGVSADPDLPPEAPAIGKRRRALLNQLARWGSALPGDRWIAGMRVHYLVEAGDEEQAIAAAHACRAERWWCSALLGLALHEAQRFADAQAAFDAALAEMPAEERARWTDVTELLSSEDQRTYRRAGEGEQATWARRLWWLADPLWSEAGNDRLTEHYTRWTLHLIRRDARQVDRMRWRDDTREAVVRYGWFTSWKRFEPLFYGHSGELLVSYSEPRTWEWLAPLSAAREPRSLKGREWPLEEDAHTPTRYAPEYATRVLPLPHQVAVFPRGGRAVLVAGYALPADSLPVHPRIRASAVAMPDPDGARAVSPWQPTAASGALMLELPWRNAVVSVEVREDSTGLLARQRQAVSWDDRARVSDLLLLAHPDARPEDLDEAARLARGSTDVRPGERIGVFWEMYGLPADDSVTVRVGLLGERPGWARRQLESLGIARGSRPVRLGWREETEGKAIAPRSLAVGIPPDLQPGEYTLELTVTAPGRSVSITRRTLTVTDQAP